MTASSNMQTDYGVNDPVVPVFDEKKKKEMGFDTETEGLTYRERRQRQIHSNWEKYWEIQDHETKVFVF